MNQENTSIVISDKAGHSKSAHFFFWTVTVLSTAVDLLSKWWIFKVLPSGGEMKIIPGFLHFKTVNNQGAVFGMGAGKRWRFVAARIEAMVFIIQLFSQSKKRQRVFHFLLALTLGGAIGNLYDRIVFGTVRDFIYMIIHAGQIELWPFIFNIADVALVVGVCGLLLGWMLGKFDLPYSCPVARPATVDTTCSIGNSRENEK